MKPPFTSMQSAVDIVLSSPHPDNKVAASLFTSKKTISKTNEWPDLILEKLGKEARIGDSSGTLHAEVNCLLNFDAPTDGASMAITDPCCPNCAKAIAESGIKTLYIDHKGFQKDFAVRRGDEFNDMSLSMMAHAGIAIYEINRKAETLVPIHVPAENNTPPEDNPIEIKQIETEPDAPSFQALIDGVHIKHDRWGCAFAKDKTGKYYSLIASTHAAIGYSEQTASRNKKDDKYDLFLEPLSRLLFGAVKHGLDLVDGYIWLSSLPTPREMVNFAGKGLKTLAIGDLKSAKKEAAFAARETLESQGILTFRNQKRKT